MSTQNLDLAANEAVGGAPVGAHRRGVVTQSLNRLAEIALFLLAGAVIVAAAGPIAGWWHYEVIESGSMTPAMRVGGVAIVVPEPVDTVRVGQILAFHPPGMKAYVRIHRVISLSHRGDEVWVTTKGDANPTADPGPVGLKGRTAYVETAFVPYVGYAGVWLYKHSTRTALEAVLFVLMLSGGLWLIWGKEEEEASASEDGKQIRPWALPSTASAPAITGRLSAHVPAQKAATASLVALNHMYAAEAEGAEPEPEHASPTRHARTGP